MVIKFENKCRYFRQIVHSTKWHGRRLTPRGQIKSPVLYSIPEESREKGNQPCIRIKKKRSFSKFWSFSLFKISSSKKILKYVKILRLQKKKLLRVKY